MKFYKIKSESEVDKHGNGIFLMHTKWDDWFTFKVEYMCWYYLDSKKGELGGIKIGAFSQGDTPFVEIPDEFDQLSADFFSLGTDESFYSNLARDLPEHREQILTGLNDIAFNKERLKKALSTNVFKTALSRYVSLSSITGRFHRLAMGDAELTDHHFAFNFKNEAGQKIELNFSADYLSAVPTNIHALIGRNGVGKSYILNEMVGSLVKEDGRFSFNDESNDKFTSLLYVNLSSFEHKENYQENPDPQKGIVFQKLTTQTFQMVQKPQGNMTKKEDDVSSPDPRAPSVKKTYEDRIEATFIDSLKVCMLRKPTRWREAVQVLQTDPVFDEVNAQNLSVNYANKSDFEGNAQRLFSRLSSGHKVVLLVLTKLVELSEEGTLIIIDEPEMHLHPPLIGSFVRALSELLRHVNGVAILATHSPIVLQEVPRCNVYKVVRNQGSSTVQRPTIETFGESIGVLTSEVFGYEVENSGFHQLLVQEINTGKSYDAIKQKFGKALSPGALSALQVLIFAHESEGD